MFGLFKKKNGELTKLLDSVENIQRAMRKNGVYAPIKYMNEVFEKLDDPTLKLSSDQAMSIQICLDEIGSRIDAKYTSVIKYECEQIFARMDRNKVYTAKDEELSAIELSRRIAEADLADEREQLAILESEGGADIDKQVKESKILELEEKAKKLREEYDAKVKEN